MREDVIKVFPKAPAPDPASAIPSEHQSLAMLEYFVHFDVADLAREWVETSNLPANWRESAVPPELARLGYEFAQRGENCLLVVPSVLAPNENNWLINPAHRDYKRIGVREVEPPSYDPRMFRKQYSHAGTNYFEQYQLSEAIERIPLIQETSRKPD